MQSIVRSESYDHVFSFLFHRTVSKFVTDGCKSGAAYSPTEVVRRSSICGASLPELHQMLSVGQHAKQLLSGTLELFS